MQDAPEVSPKKIFVGNIPFSTTEEELVNLFSEYGTISEAALIVDRFNGRSKGIAFITFETEEEAKAAIEAMNGFEIEGRELVVNVARPKVPRNNNRGNFNRGNRNNGGDRI